jgi:hypothetical protein
MDDSPRQSTKPDEPCPPGGVVTPPPSNPDEVYKGGCEIGPDSQKERAHEARRHRLEAAYCPHHDPRCEHEEEEVCKHYCNGDEAYYYKNYDGQFIASYTKGLPHDAKTGLGDPDVYKRLLCAMATGKPEDFEKIRPLGCEKREQDRCKEVCRTDDCAPPPNEPPTLPPPQRALENPQGGFAYELEGADSHALYMPPAPCFDSVQEAAEIAEDYWMALTRDVPFIRYGSDPLIQRAVADMNAVFKPSDLSPHLTFPAFTPRNIFRGPTRGDRKGPYISQFLLLDVPYGAQFLPAMIRTLRPGIDFMTNWDDWLAVQDGCDADQTNCDPVPRLIRSGRDIAQYVHVDRDFNAFLNACLLMLYGREPLRRCEARPGLGVPFAPCLPYVNPMAPMPEEFPRTYDPKTGKSQNQIGQATFGEQHFKSVLLGSLYRAFHAVWFQKWSVHRRLRPEEFGGRVHLAKLYRDGEAAGKEYPVNPVLWDSALFKRVQPGDPEKGYVYAHNRCLNGNRRTPPRDLLHRCSWDGTYLLPMAFAEGSPLHPSYGSGHSTASGCMITILKAFFHNDWTFPNPVEANEDGTSVRLYNGPDACGLTVAGELDKLASNIGLGRDWGGVHWRSDHEEGMILGEQMAISILCDQRNLFNEYYEFRIRTLDFGPYEGKVLRIRPGATYWKEGQKCEACAEVTVVEDYAAEDCEVRCEKRRRPYEKKK